MNDRSLQGAGDTAPGAHLDRPLPGWGAVFRRQLGVIGWRRGWLPVGVVLPLLGLLEVSRRRRLANLEERFPTMSEFLQERYLGRAWAGVEPALFDLSAYVGIVAVVWALVVWHGEAGDRRNHHLAFPVPGSNHDVHRVLAGAVYLLAALAVVALVGFGLSWSEGSWTYWTDGVRGHGDPAMFWTQWFTWPLTAYLAASIYPLLTSRPVEWIIGTVATLFVGTVIIDVAPLLRPLAYRLDQASYWLPEWALGTLPPRLGDGWTLVLVGMGLPLLAFAGVAFASGRRP